MTSLMKADPRCRSWWGWLNDFVRSPIMWDRYRTARLMETKIDEEATIHVSQCMHCQAYSQAQ